MISMKTSGSVFSSYERLLLFIILSGFIAAYLPVFRELATAWYNSEDYSHGFFVLPLSIYFIWAKRDVIRQQPISVALIAIPFFIGSLVLYILAIYAGIKTVAGLSIITTIASSVWLLFGFPLLRAIIFPIFFLVFMIPVPEQMYSSLTAPLQLFVSQISVELTRLLEIPVFREGNVIHLPDKTFEVVRACSGIRSLITLLCICVIFSFFFLRKTFFKITLVASCLPISIFVNIVRVYLIIIVFHYFNIDISEGVYHTFFGLILFIVSLFMVNFAKEVLLRWDIKD